MARWRWLRRYPELRTVIVNTRTRNAFRGVLYERSRRHVLLKNVEMLRAGNESLRMDGDVLIEQDNVDWIQIVS